MSNPKLTKEEKKSLRKELKGKRVGLFKEFANFINRGNVLNLAVGIIIGSAFTGIVTSLTQGILMPLIGYVIGEFDLSTIKQVLIAAVFDAEGNVLQPEVAILWGAFLQKVLDFILMAGFIFLLLKVISSATKRVSAIRNHLAKKTEEAQAPALVKPSTDEQILKVLNEISDTLKKQENK